MKNLLLLALLVFAACGGPRTLMLDHTARQPRVEVELLRSEPSRPYKAIAEFSEHGPREDEIMRIKQYLKAAGRLGADALIMSTPEDAGMRGRFSPYGGGFNTHFHFQGTAIVWH